MVRLIFAQLICGIAARHHAWQRQTLHFGHVHEDKYTVLVCDNRGSGHSDKPWWYSTSEMARDLIEVLDHVGWTEPRSVHIVGLSLGGMIAQEMAMLVPERIGTLNLLHTAAKFELTWRENLASWSKVLEKKTLDQTLAAAALAMFSHKWLAAPDDCEVPQRGVPGVRMPDDGKGEYLMFDNNFQRYAAQEINKQYQPDYGPADQWGILGHLIAGAWHVKSEKQLTHIADSVGRDRILVLHTTTDGMVPPKLGQKLMNILQPGTAMMMDDEGHVPKLEKARWFNDLMEKSFAKGEELTRLEKLEKLEKP